MKRILGLAALLIMLAAGPARADGCIAYFSDGTSQCVVIPKEQQCVMPDAQHMRVSGKRIERVERVVKCLGRDGGLGRRGDAPARRKAPRGCECVVNTGHGVKTFVLQGVPSGRCMDECRKRFGGNAALHKED
ncbi:hypothetical protein [Desulfocurvus sp. DL9XJH121]